jgi:long-chain acyl-CoA synthetase
MLSHGNLVAVARSHVDDGAIGLPEDIHISYLPLAHIYERIVLNGMLASGCQIGFFRGDVSLLMEDIAVLRPTIFVSVPRLLNRVYERITTTATTSGSAIKTTLFKKAVEAKLTNMKTNGSLTHPLWDTLVFKKVKAALGGRVRLICSGSAPISADVLNFLRIAFSCQVLEGYGSTESAAGLTCNWLNDFNSHTVGAPVTW